MKLGILFAGQGSQTVGMGKDLYESCMSFQEIFDLLPAEQHQIAFEGPMEQLSDTRNTQPVSYTHLDVYKRQALQDSTGLQSLAS